MTLLVLMSFGLIVGFGLSYTTFEYSNLNIRKKTYGDEGYLEAAWAQGNVANHWIGSSLDTWCVNKHVLSVCLCRSSLYIC